MDKKLTVMPAKSNSRWPQCKKLTLVGVKLLMLRAVKPTDTGEVIGINHWAAASEKIIEKNRREGAEARNPRTKLHELAEPEGHSPGAPLHNIRCEFEISRYRAGKGHGPLISLPVAAGYVQDLLPPRLAGPPVRTVLGAPARVPFFCSNAFCPAFISPTWIGSC